MTGKILIVEDDPILSLLLKTMFKRMGYEIVGAVDNANDALLALKETTPDVVLMDIKIQGRLDGIDTMREIKKIADIPVIYTSGNSDAETLKRAAEIGYAAFLMKPFIESDLRVELEKVLASKN